MSYFKTFKKERKREKNKGKGGDVLIKIALKLDSHESGLLFG